MQSLANYDILTNFHYADALCYTTMDQRDEENEKENSDLVATAVFLGEQRIEIKTKTAEELAIAFDRMKMTNYIKQQVTYHRRSRRKMW